MNSSYFLSFQNYKFDKGINFNLNLVLILYLLSYIAGPAIINIFITFLSIFSLFYLFKNRFLLKRLFYNLSSLIFLIFFLFIVFKDFFLLKFNPDIVSFTRFIIIFLSTALFAMKSQEKININFNLLISLIIILFFDTIFQHFFGSNILGFEKYNSNRLTSFFDDEPIIGSFLMKISIPIIFLFFKKKFNLLHILSFLIFLILSIYCVIISGERMPFLQLLLGILLIFFFKFSFSYKKIFLFLMLPLISVIIIFITPNIKDRYTSTFENMAVIFVDIKNTNRISFEKSQNSINDYVLNFQSGLVLWKKNIIFGNGFRFYHNNCSKVLNSPYREGCSTHPHNIYIEILSDHGLIGLFLFLSFVMIIIKDFYKNCVDKNSFGFLITLFVISFPFVTSQSIFSSYYGSIYFLFFFIVKILTNKTKKI